MNITNLRKYVFVLLFFFMGLNIFSQPFTEVTSFTTGPNNIWKNSYAFWVDVDNDKDLDFLFIESEGDGISKLYRNDLTGFTPFSLPFTGGLNACIGDFDRDGYTDFAMLGSPVKIYRNNHTTVNWSFTALPNGTVPVGVSYDGPIDCGDYDNDGDLDLLINNIVCRNNGNNTFTKMENIVLATTSEGGSKWGDYDNDGYLDIVITGSTPDGYQTKIYRNTGNSSFTELTGLSLAAGIYGVTEWGDYDNDGDLDLIVTGYNGYTNHFTTLYKNDGANGFTAVTGLPFLGHARGSVRWGDYDNDGDLDILFTGLRANISGGEYTKIYKNNGNDSFAEYTGFTFPAIGRGSAIWGDYDKDGDLDIALIGNLSTGVIAKLFRNDINPVNKIPSAPQGPLSTVKNQDVTLRWKSVKDGDTPYKGITYNLMIGTATDPNNLMPSHSSSGGYRGVAEFGNAWQDTTLLLKKIPFGNYFWKVQAIDNNFEGGAFSSEGTFNVSPQQTKNLSARILDQNSLVLRWERGTGDRCLVFAKQASSGTAAPADGTGYIADCEFGFGSQIGTTGWFCLYNGRSDSVNVTGLLSNTLYSFHIFEYSGNFGSEDYMTDLTGNGNPGIFSTNNFANQTNIVFGAGDYNNKALWIDYDNDGFQDIFLVGNPAKLYRNSGNNTFVVVPESEFSFPAIESGAAAWGDFDNDKDLDLIITGNPSVPVSKIYRNKGASGFEDISASLISVYLSSVAWGDYDNDGDIDLLMNGATGASPNFNPVSKIYKNAGPGQFIAETAANLTGLFSGSANWGDYDNDGDLDILMTGTTSAGTYKTEIYKNNGLGNFSLVNSLIPGYQMATASFGDYDNDGDLDIIIGDYVSLRIFENKGNDNFQQHLTIDPPFATAGCPSYAEWADFNNDGFLDFIYALPPLWFTRIYINTQGQTLAGAVSNWFILYDGTLKKNGNGSAALSDYDNDGDIDILLSKYYAPTEPPSVIRNSLLMKSGSYPSNSAPSAPTGIMATNTPSGVLLKWNPVKNDETPYKTMTYNIRIGTSETSWNICPPNSADDGYRKIPSMGNMQTDTSYLIVNLPSDVYYWSVQAVDQGYKGGSWSSTGSFEVKNVQAFFSADEVCLGLPTHFTDQSVATKGIASWLWEFGDGTTSTAHDPEHAYATSGTYSVELTITDTEAATDFLVQNVTVKQKPAANFTASTVCHGTATTFTNTTNNNGLSISAWSWNFGDGETSNAQNPGSHPYFAATDYIVTLGAMANNGCFDEISKTISVVSYPVAAVSADGATTFCSGQSVTLSTPINANYTYVWRRDGANITGAITNTYMAQISGNYIASVTNKGLCTTPSSEVTVTVNTAPSAPLISAGGPLTFCQGDSVLLSVTNNPVYSYQWKLNGGAVGTNSYLYSANTSGTYTLVVTNASGCSANSTNTVAVTVNPKPVLPSVNLSGPTSFCQGGNVELSVTTAAGYSYQWENNGAAISGASSNTFTANTSGIFSLRITNTNNCYIKTENISVNVLTVPLAPAISTSGTSTFCSGDSVILSVTNTPGYTYQWKLNGGSTGANSNQIVAKNTGEYSLVVTNSSGCTVSSLAPVPVGVNPLPVLSVISVKGKEKFCSGESATLSVPSNANYSYSWKKGTNPLDLTTNSIVTSESGDYTVDISLAGCRVTAEPVKIEVVQKPLKPSIDTSFYDKGMCLGESPLKIAVADAVAGYIYRWYRNGSPISNSTSIEVLERGNYQLEAVSDICTSLRDSAFIDFKETLPKPYIIARGPTVWMLSTTSKASQYKWFLNGSLIPGAGGSSYVASQNYGIYRLAVADEIGCFSFSDTLRIPLGVTGIEDPDPFEGVKIYPNPTTGLFTIEMNNNIFGELVIDIFTQSGSKVINIKFDKTTEHFQSQIDLSGQPNGMYLINLSLDKFRAVKKVLVE